MASNRQKINSLLRDNIRQRLARLSPSFIPYAERSVYLSSAERAYFHSVNSDVQLFLILVPDRKGADRFTIEIGWSKLGRFPRLSMRPSFDEPTESGEEFLLDEYVCRLGRVMVGADRWWHVPRVADEKTVPGDASLQASIDEVASRVVDEIRRFGVPYLNRFMQTIALRPPSQ